VPSTSVSSPQPSLLLECKSGPATPTPAADTQHNNKNNTSSSSSSSSLNKNKKSRDWKRKALTGKGLVGGSVPLKKPSRKKEPYVKQPTVSKKKYVKRTDDWKRQVLVEKGLFVGSKTVSEVKDRNKGSETKVVGEVAEMGVESRLSVLLQIMDNMKGGEEVSSRMALFNTGR